MAKTTWGSDALHSELNFKIRHLMISNVSGTFGNFNVQVETEEEDFKTATINASIDMHSISTHNAQRDEHLRNSDFFETAKYPQATFISDKIEQSDKTEFIVHGTLTMKGVSQPVQLHAALNGIAKDPWGGERAGFLVTGKINRNDWGINFNSVLETGGVALGEEVKLSAELQLVKQPVAATADANAQ